jgi:hypothetical protein
MRDAWKRLRRRMNALLIEGLARGFVLFGLAWLLACVWRDEHYARRLARGS